MANQLMGEIADLRAAYDHLSRQLQEAYDARDAVGAQRAALERENARLREAAARLEMVRRRLSGGRDNLLADLIGIVTSTTPIPPELKGDPT